MEEAEAAGSNVVCTMYSMVAEALCPPQTRSAQIQKTDDKDALRKVVVARCVAMVASFFV
jgi:hypothetical protein